MIDKLSWEILEIIVSDKSLSIKDVLNLSETCQRLNDIRYLNNIWKRLFKLRWPNLKGIPNSSWYAESIYLLNLENELQAYIESIKKRFRYKTEVDDEDFAYLIGLATYSENSYNYVYTYMLNCVNQEYVAEHPYCKSSMQYYILKGIQCIRKIKLREEWKDMKQADPEVKLEKGYEIFNHWFLPHIEVNLGERLDEIAAKVRGCLRTDHPIFASIDSPCNWKSGGLKTSQFSKAESIEIIKAMRYVIGDLVRTHFLRTPLKVQLFLFNYVFRYGIGHEIILNVIYQAIGRRLGLKFDIVHKCGIYLLRFIQSYEEAGDTVYFITAEWTDENEIFLTNVNEPESFELLSAEKALEITCKLFLNTARPLIGQENLYGWSPSTLNDFFQMIIATNSN